MVPPRSRPGRLGDSINKTDGNSSGAPNEKWPTWIATAVLAIAIVAVYGRGLNAPFILDDEVAIVRNPSITSLWPLVGSPERPGPLRPLPNSPTVARPLVNLSFALNCRFGGLNPFGFHAVNMFIHILTA